MTTPAAGPAVKRLTVTLECCPWQAEGELGDGRVFYMRHRFCTASLGIGADLEAAVKDSFLHQIEYHENNAGDCPSVRPPARNAQGYCSGLEGEEIAYVFQRLWAER